MFVIISIQARQAEVRGDLQGAQNKARVAFILNFVSILFGIIGLYGTISLIMMLKTTQRGYHSYYCDQYCYYYTSYRSAFYTYYSYNNTKYVYYTDTFLNKTCF